MPRSRSKPSPFSSPPAIGICLFLLVAVLFALQSIIFSCLVWITNPSPSASSVSEQILGYPAPLDPIMFSCLRKMKFIEALNPNNRRKSSSSLSLGSFGWMMVRMLGSDLPFTLFVPSESCFQDLLEQQKHYAGTLKGTVSGSMFSRNQLGEDNEELYAIVSRVLGFSAVPKLISANEVPTGGEMELETISGYKLYLSNDKSRGLLVNNLTWEFSDFKRGHVTAHLVRGVLMDTEFEQSMVFEDFTDEDPRNVFH